LRSQTKSTQGGTRDPAPQWAQQLDQLERSAELIERLLGDPQLRRRFRSDPATVLVEAGLPELAAGLGPGRRAMMTLELRESRSSLAGMMVAAAAEGVDFAHFAERAVPDLAHDPAAHPQAAHHQPAAQAPVTPVPEPGSVLSYPGDQATPQQLAAWMGARAQQAGLPPELPVMAALTESGRAVRRRGPGG
jgi:hypothetical protein